MARPKQFNEQEVLNKAIHLFWEKGYNATSIQDLVNHLGINRASLYDTFGGKSALYQSALSEYKKQNWSAMVSLLNSGLPVKEIIGQLMENALTEMTDVTGFKGCFVVNSAVELAPHDPEVHKLVQNNAEAFVNAFAEVFRKGQESGEVPLEKDPVALARYLYNTFNGMRVMAKSKPDPDFLKDIIETSLYPILH